METDALHTRENKTVRSADGTRIGFTRIGSGPAPVVIVHGALNSGEQWMRVATAMADQCTCYVMDRWGRGGSANRTDYSLEREVEDIVAVLEAAGPDAYLVGHSSGAIYTLEAARQASLAGLILYEPPLHGFHGRFVEEILDPIRDAAAEERFDDVVYIFLRREGKMSEDQLAQVQGTPLWDQRVALAPHSVREWEELARHALEVERYEDLAMPALLLTGGETQNHPSFATKALQEKLPDVRTTVLDGQGHTANLMAPEMVAREIIDFIVE